VPAQPKVVATLLNQKISQSRASAQVAAPPSAMPAVSGLTAIEAQLGGVRLREEGEGPLKSGTQPRTPQHASPPQQQCSAPKSVPQLSSQGRPCSSTSTSFSPLTNSLLSSAVEDREESAMRQCFAETFEREVEHLRSQSVEVNKERKSQILADILVWAEISQQHYEATTRDFVVAPNVQDESFVRVGRFLHESQQLHGMS